MGLEVLQLLLQNKIFTLKKNYEKRHKLILSRSGLCFIYIKFLITGCVEDSTEIFIKETGV